MNGSSELSEVSCCCVNMKARGKTYESPSLFITFTRSILTGKPTGIPGRLKNATMLLPRVVENVVMKAATAMPARPLIQAATRRLLERFREGFDRGCRRRAGCG